jgi:HPr kinase/phosphorylase
MTAPDASGTTLHASCVLVGEAGVLIRGASGSGKSALAHMLLVEGALDGGFARLVCDDRVRVERRGGRLLARAVPRLAGYLEVRGVGILAVRHEAAAVIRLVVDCLGHRPDRLPETADQVETIHGVALPRLALRPEPALARIVLWRLRALADCAFHDRALEDTVKASW